MTAHIYKTEISFKQKQVEYSIKYFALAWMAVRGL